MKCSWIMNFHGICGNCCLKLNKTWQGAKENKCAHRVTFTNRQTRPLSPCMFIAANNSCNLISPPAFSLFNQITVFAKYKTTVGPYYNIRLNLIFKVSWPSGEKNKTQISRKSLTYDEQLTGFDDCLEWRFKTDFTRYDPSQRQGYLKSRKYYPSNYG